MTIRWQHTRGLHSPGTSSAQRWCALLLAKTTCVDWQRNLSRSPIVQSLNRPSKHKPTSIVLIQWWNAWKDAVHYHKIETFRLLKWQGAATQSMCAHTTLGSRAQANPCHSKRHWNPGPFRPRFQIRSRKNVSINGHMCRKKTKTSRDRTSSRDRRLEASKFAALPGICT